MRLAVEALHRYRAGPLYQSAKAGKTEASFKEFHPLLGGPHDSGIDENQKRYGPPLPRGQQLDRDILEILSAVLDYNEL